MKIVCDSCGTKYSISDDKVRGKVFKIRCKKCSHIIVVRGTNEAAAAAAPAAAAPADAGGWHLVVDGDQVGPVSEADIRGRIERGEVNAETYVWKEGFADWLKLSAIPELAPLVQPADGGVFADGTGSGGVGSGRVNGEGASRQSGPVAAGGLFGGAPMGDEADVFGSPAPAAAAKRGGGGDLFASPAVVSKPAAEESRWPAASAAPAGHDGGRVENLTGQRHENSVLFSLSNLQSLAMPAPASSKPSLSTTAPTAEGSGLIDIRAMAATTLGSSGGGGASFGGGGPGDDLPAFGSFSPAAPVLLALPTSSGPSKWVYIGIAAIGVLLIGVIAMAIMVFGSKPVATVAAPAATAVAPGAPAAAPSAPVAANAPAAAAAPTQIPANELPPRAEAPKPAEAAAAAAKGEHEHHHHGGKDSGGSSKKAGGDDGKKASAPAAAAPVAAAPPPEKRPAKGSLDDLLEGALQHKPAAAAPKPHAEDSSASAGGGGPLAKSAVVAGMNSVKGKISDCYQQFKVPGMAMVNVVIGKNGRVSSATCTGKFAGTPTGACVEKAVKSASFPPSDGLSTPYPFQLK
jgi:predicted Zn finger-like uncharacterized protein